MLHEIIERLSDELSRPAFYKKADRTIHLPADLVADIVTNLVWAADEIAQLSEDLSGATGAVCQMTDELKGAEAEIAELRDEVASYERGELLADQHLDYWLAV